MSEYKGIRGFKVQTLSTDPAASVIATGTWSSGGALNTARQALGSQGTQTAALAAGGSNASKVANVEIYDGSSWTEVADINLARNFIFGFGTTTAGLVTGGLPASFPPFSTANTETWNGTAWTEVNDLNTARGAGASATSSPNTAGLIAGGGYVGPTAANTNVVESWNGTSWTEVADLNTTRSFLSGLGIQTAALATGGSPITGVTEQWNGSSWTEVSDLNTSRRNAGTSGLYTDGLAFGGDTDPGWISATEHFDGTSWTELNDLSIARRTNGCGTSPTALAIGGANDSYISATEEWNVSPPASFSQLNLGQVYYNSTSNAFKVTKINYPAGTWASNTASPTAITETWGTGLSNSDALIGTPTGVAMEWNGSAWTDGGTINNTANAGRGGTGGISAALIWGGTSVIAATESYNGTAWTEVNDLNTGGNNQPAGPTGTYTDLIAAGRGPGWAAVSESWNGTSWTETSDLSTARRALGSSGSSSTNCAVFGGNVPPNTSSALTETWNGTSWTEVADLNTARFSGMGFGDSSGTAAYVAGSSFPSLPPYNTKTEFFNGTAWTEVNDLTNGRYHNKGGGSGASALTAGGYLASPAGGTTTENYVWEAPTGNSTITVS